MYSRVLEAVIKVSCCFISSILDNRACDFRLGGERVERRATNIKLCICKLNIHGEIFK